MTVAVEVLGVRIDIGLPDGASPELTERISTAWAHCLAIASVPSPHRVEWRGPDVSTGMHLLSQEVTRCAIDARAGQSLLLHAAAVADPVSGATVVVVGGSGAGKTTWVQTHGHGRRYVSDETVCVGPDLRVSGVAKPLSLGFRETKQQRAPAEFGLLMAEGTERLAALWLLDRDGTTPARLTPIDLLDALPPLAAQASYLTAMPRPLHRLADVVTACGGLHRAQYDEAADLTEHLTEALA